MEDIPTILTTNTKSYGGAPAAVSCVEQAEKIIIIITEHLKESSPDEADKRNEGGGEGGQRETREKKVGIHCSTIIA